MKYNKKGIIGITLAAIMIASIFAMVAPTTVAKWTPKTDEPYPNSTVRIYGDVFPMGNAPERYSDWTQPFDPTVIPKDSITFNPAILEWDMSAQSTDANEKTYLRAWYEPCGKYWGPRKNHTYPTINLEYTYMYIDQQDKMPWHGSAGDSTFAFPICEIENQTGLGAFENTLVKSNSYPAIQNLVDLVDVDGEVGAYNKTVDGRIAIQKKYYLESGEKIQFLDHKLQYIGTDVDATVAVVRVWYAGNTEDDSAKVVLLPKCETQYFKRHNEMRETFSEDYPWFAHFEFKMQDSHLGAIDVGRYLWNCSVFYVDGVRYDVTAVEVLDKGYCVPDGEADPTFALDADTVYVQPRWADGDPNGWIPDPAMPTKNQSIEFAITNTGTKPCSDLVLHLTEVVGNGGITLTHWSQGLDTDEMYYDLPTINPGQTIPYTVMVYDMWGDFYEPYAAWDWEIVREADGFKYITLRTKLPKGTGEVMDESRVSSQFIDRVDFYDVLPVLPPFNMNHSIVDDIDIPLWAPLLEVDKWPEGDSSGAPGMEYFPGAEAYLTMQYPPWQWLKFFYAVPANGSKRVEISSGPGTGFTVPSWPHIWENYGGPFYPGTDVPPYWLLDKCGMRLEPGEYNTFDPTNWIAMDVEARIIDDVEPLDVYYIAEAVEQRLSTDLLEKLHETGMDTFGGIYENWTKFDIQTLPDQYTDFALPAVPDLTVTTKFEQNNTEQTLNGDYLITTSLIAPNNRGGDFPGDRVAFSYDRVDGMDGIDLYVNADPKDTTKNVTVRIYGDVTPGAYPDRYDNWEQPFNPTVIRKDSITFDPAKLYGDMSAQSTDAALKEYLRAWYQPCYNFSKKKLPAVVTETTYMLVDKQDEKPWHGSAGDTWFAFPIAADETTAQIGLERFENSYDPANLTWPAADNVTKLTLVSTVDGNPVGYHNKSVYGKIRLEKKYYVDITKPYPTESEWIQFLDHKIKYLGTSDNGTVAVIQVAYAGNTDGVEPHIKTININQSQTIWLDRHNVMYDGPNHKTHPVHTWYIHFEFKMQDTHVGAIDIGKELEHCDVFYVDGVRYEVMAIEVLDWNGDEFADKFKYITLKTPFAKGTGTFDDSAAESSITISKIPACNPIPVLPPMNREHLIVDDTDVVLWQPLTCLDKWPYGDPHGAPGTEYWPCAERYLTMQYPPYPWLKFFRAVPIDTDGDIATAIPHAAHIWENYGGPFYPGDEVPGNWTLCKCGIKMYGATGPGGDKYWTVFDNEHWIANDVDERMIGPIGPLEFCWKSEDKEPRYSTNLLQILYENITGDAPVEEGWTKYDIQTLPDMYTEFDLPVIPSLNPLVYIGGTVQDYFKPDMREYPGSYLITTSFWAPNARGDFNLNQTYQQGNRYAFTFNASNGKGIYFEEDPPADPVECMWSFNLKEGKDYVSLPAIPGDASPDAVFGVDVEVKGYDPITGWYTPTTLKAGEGYLVRCADPKTTDIYGTNVEGRTWASIKAELQSGDNLVGLGDTDVTIGDNVVVIGWDAVEDQWVTLHKGDTLRRGTGYWIKG